MKLHLPARTSNDATLWPYGYCQHFFLFLPQEDTKSPWNTAENKENTLLSLIMSGTLADYNMMLYIFTLLLLCSSIFHFWQKLLWAAACKYQTSPHSSRKSTSILFHEKNPYIELFFENRV